MDPLAILRDYGFHCCSDISRSFAEISAHLGYETRVGTTKFHEFPEVKLKDRWQIIDPDKGLIYLSSKTRKPLSSIARRPEIETIANALEVIGRSHQGSEAIVSSEELADIRNAYAFKDHRIDEWSVPEINKSDHFLFFPGDRLEFNLQETTPSWFNGEPNLKAPQVSTARLVTYVKKHDDHRRTSSTSKELSSILLFAPFPIIEIRVQRVDGRHEEFSIVLGPLVKQSAGGTVVLSRKESGAYLPNLRGPVELNLKGNPQSLRISILMQFNSRLFDSEHRALTYKDDSGECRRTLTFVSDTLKTAKVLAQGSRDCSIGFLGSTKPLSFPLSHPKARNIIKELRGCSLGKWGLQTHSGEKCTAVFEFPLEYPNLSWIKASTKIDFEWFVKRSNGWKRVPAVRAGRYVWVELGRSIPDDSSVKVLAIANEVTEENADQKTVVDFIGYQQGPNSIAPRFIKF